MSRAVVILSVGLGLFPAVAGVAEPVSIPRQAGVALGISARNLLNLSAAPNATGFVLDRDGNRVAVFPTVRTGIGDTMRQFEIYQSQGYNTVRKIIVHWVSNPASNTEPEIMAVSAALGVGPNDPIDMHDRATAAAFIWAAQPYETGRLTSTSSLPASTSRPIASRPPSPISVQVLTPASHNEIGFGR